MSQENVELIRRGYRLFNARDTEGWLALFHPNAELKVSGVFPGFDPVYRGRRGVRQFSDTLLEAWESFEGDIRELVDRGDYIGIALTIRAKGRGSGVDVRLPFHHAFYFEDGLIRRWASYPTLDKALEAVGLPE